MDLQTTFYIVGIIFICLILVLIIALVIAVLAIRAKIRAIENVVKGSVSIVGKTITESLTRVVHTKNNQRIPSTTSQKAEQKRMNFITKLIYKIDTFQQNHAPFSFIYAVIKKYGTDNGSYQSALITYYGLLSLFPLLIVFTTLTQLFLKNDAALRIKVSTSITHYFPIIGNELQQGVHSPTKTGIALIVTLLITLYGARGGANALQYAVSTLWYVPLTERPPFLKNILRSFGIIFGGGLGLVSAVVISGFTTFLGHSIITRVLAILLSTFILWVTFIFLFKLAIAGKKSIKDVRVGALVAAIGLQILQIVGNIVLAHEMKGLKSTYGTFALVIGLMFWIYLQAEVILYAVEIDVVRFYHLFPRSIQEPLTESDKVALAKIAKTHTQHQKEDVGVEFHRH